MNKILAIDDKKDNLITISALIESLLPDSSVITSESGNDGIEKAIYEQPDVIILDVKMPKMDGFEVCSILKSSDMTKHIPIILLTAIKTDTDSRVRGLELGADAFLAKPIDETELIAQIKVMLRIKKAEDMLRKEKDLLEDTVKERTLALEKSRNELIKERDFIKSLSDASPAYFVAVFPDGNIMTMNKAMLEATGYKSAEVKGKNYIENFPAKSDQKNSLDNFNNLKRKKNHQPFTNSIVTKSGIELAVEWHGKPIFKDNDELDFVFFVGIDVTERKQLEKIIMDDNEKERNRIGQNLHDGLGQHLAGISFKSEILKLKLQDKAMEEAKDAEEINKLVNQAINQARDLAKGLCPIDMAGGGLRSALEDLRAATEKNFSINCFLNWNDNVSIENSIEASHLYYIAREAVNNAIKHGRAQNIIITAGASNNSTVLKIADDGIGIPANPDYSSGTGISIMQYRAWIIGAAFSVEKGEGSGALVSCTLKNATYSEQKGISLDIKTRHPGISGKDKSKIIIVDDHPIVRQGLQEIINRESDMAVTGEAKNADEAVRILAKQKPDMMIVDISLQGASGIDLISVIRNRYPDIPILVLSIHDEALYAERAIKVGARGYVMKQEAPQTIIQAIKTVLSGKQYLSEKTKEKILDKISIDRFNKLENGVSGLTNREFEVFHLIGNGLGNRQIAEKLNISIKTVENYRERIKNKLGTDSSSDVVQLAVQWVINKTKKE